MTAPESDEPRRRQPVFGGSEEPNSLFGEILDWMLAPLLLLWPISIAATNHVANEIANQPYDQALAENVAAIARLVRIVEGRAVVSLPVPVRAVLHTDSEDTLYFQVRGPRGDILSGDDEIHAAPGAESAGPEETRFRDDNIGGEPVRVAWRAIAVEPGRSPAVIQVAETRRKREALASRIISGVLLPQFAIIPLAVILVWLGLSKGLAPLARFRRQIGERRPGDLSPIATRGVPDELQPMIVSFNGLMARLEQNLQAQQRFIADAAHQMKTPLTGLKTQTELALRENDPAQMHRSLEQIARSTDRASHLIHQLLALARAESSHDKVHKFEMTDLDALARDVAREWVPRALAGRIDLGFEGTDWPLLIDGVPLLLRQLLDNLIDNALKYTPAGGRVTVRVQAGERATIAVEDSGIGIPEADRERVFEPFYRVLGTDADGSGLGLAICREIAELHRGDISLAAGEGGAGTRIALAFPRCRNASLLDEFKRVAQGNEP
ncbi:MAG: sensor histidine kinase N-terminal domain-containing protein [Candidatus Nitricoxidivorans perseverans]|uniref:histidine kinase n=1 Tax=Candidatus Nitricoxidivorans perseverans TaxID=2975601 RepID=A0AA49FIZ1_9PROT|nr:MAG: sensor histidine kinase N-terminal domain-containing protein [Candidatus Nitricoxidivorans perseverans]